LLSASSPKAELEGVSGPKTHDEAEANPRAHTFTLQELKAATNNFAQECFIGEGGFGPVYKGYLNNKSVSCDRCYKDFGFCKCYSSKHFFISLILYILNMCE